MQNCLDNQGCTVPLYWSKARAAALEHIDRNSDALGNLDSPFAPMISLQAYAKGKGSPAQDDAAAKNKIFHCSYKEDDTAIPYLNGSDIERYAYTWSGSYLKFGKWLAEAQPLERFSGPRLLIREIINAAPNLLNACYCAETMLYNKSVLHVLARPGTSAEQVRALLALLNSKLASFVIMHRGRKSQRRLFPKIVNADLKDFPLARKFNGAVPELASLAEQLMAAEKNTAEIELRINTSVYSMYNLRNSDVQQIENDLTNADLPENN